MIQHGAGRWAWRPLSVMKEIAYAERSEGMDGGDRAGGREGVRPEKKLTRNRAGQGGGWSGRRRDSSSMVIIIIGMYRRLFFFCTRTFDSVRSAAMENLRRGKNRFLLKTFMEKERIILFILILQAALQQSSKDQKTYAVSSKSNRAPLSWGATHFSRLCV